MGTYVEDAEYVTIGGIEQFLFHTGDDPRNPVMLHLHGGPGMPFSNKAWLLRDWDSHFTTVFWDQRGAGKTALRNPDSIPTTERLLEDLHEIIAYLRQRYDKQKIGVLGHSWGSVLGSRYVLQHPDHVAFYVGVGQVVDALVDESLGAAELRRRALLADALDDVAILDDLGDYPGTVPEDLLAKMIVVRTLQTKYGIASYEPRLELDRITQSPLFRQSDLGARELSVGMLDPLYRELTSFALPDLGYEYEVPVFYLLGSDDWQVPTVQGIRYFTRVSAPSKEIRIISGSRHVPMLEQPTSFLHALRDVTSKIDAEPTAERELS